MRACNFFSFKSKAMMLFAIFVFSTAFLEKTEISAQNISISSTPAQLAAAIARTMAATRPAVPANSPITQNFRSYENIVESRTVFKDPNGFSNAVAKRRDIQTGVTRYMCKPERLAYIKRGVVFREIKTDSEGKNSFQFDIDEKACASLEKFDIADAATLERMAQSVAQQLTTELSKNQRVEGSRFQAATAQARDVKIVNIVTKSDFADYLKQRDFEIRGKTQGFFCYLFGEAIQKGVRIRVVYQSESGASILEFPIDSSVC